MKKILMAFMAFFLTLPVQAALKIDITGGGFQPVPIAVPSFSGDDDDKITNIIRADLESSGLFRLLNPDAFLQKMGGVQTQPNFPDWQALKAQALLHGEVTPLPDGRIQSSFRLWDVFASSQMEGKTLAVAEKDVRRLAHKIADMVYSRITGESGYFDTKIVYVSESGNPRKKTKRLAVMDYDGAHHQYLTDGRTMVLTPRFSPDMKKIAFLSFKGGKPRVYVMNTSTGETFSLGYFSGMTFAPRFSPDSRQLLMSFSERGNTEIYLYDLEEDEKIRLTYHPMIDTSPSFSPDGKRIVFNSDRAGSQQLYTMDKSGKNVRRISMGKGSYATPVWSPRGDYIAFTKIQGSTFYIGVIRPDGSGERLITQGFLVEGPTWSPNGRVLMFFKQELSGESGLYSIDVTGHNERRIMTPSGASDPAWSPLLR